MKSKTELIEELKQVGGQDHLVAAENDDNVMEQLLVLDKNYPGGLKNYIERARELLAKSKADVNPFEGYTPSVPDGVHIKFSCQSFAEYDKVGRDAFQKCACVLVAGGLGERLGYSGIKVGLPAEITSGLCFLGVYCGFIKYLADENVKVPLMIMTSDDTHEQTIDLLEHEKYFGLDRDQVTILKQEKVASLTDVNATIAMENGRVSTKPHGHGDVHLLLHQSGLAKKWLEEEKREWVMFFQDTNPMSFRTLPIALGVSAMRKFDVNFVAIPRKAKAAAGAIMRLVHKDGHEMTGNVEYNYIDSVLRATINPEHGDVNEANGFSMFPGNMNQLVFRLKPYVENLEKTGGVIAEFVNPKYTDETRTKFKSPTRLECMMQDYALSLSGGSSSVGVTVFEDPTYESKVLGTPSLTHRLYAPAKNGLKDAASKFAQGIPDASTTSTEMSIYACNSLILKDLGCDIGDPAMTEYGGITQPEWPHIVIHPSFAPQFGLDLARKFLHPKQVKISSRSSLVLNGANIVFQGQFTLDGALVIEACDEAIVKLENLTVQNHGSKFLPLPPDNNNNHDQQEKYTIRGYQPSSTGSISKICFPNPGHYHLQNATFN